MSRIRHPIPDFSREKIIHHCYLWSISWTPIPESLFALWRKKQGQPECGGERKPRRGSQAGSDPPPTPHHQAVCHRNHFYKKETRVQMPLTVSQGHVPSSASPTLGLVLSLPCAFFWGPAGTYIALELDGAGYESTGALSIRETH